jgi:putative flippase GtrA
MHSFKHLLRYISVGIIVNGLSFGAYVLFTSFYLKLDPVLTVVLLSPVAIVLHFILQLNFVFFQSKFTFIVLIRYLINYLFFYFLNIVLLYVATNHLYVDHVISQFIIIIFLTGFNYLLSNKFIFIK